MSKTKHQARRRAVQALYMWHITGENLSDIENQFLTEQEMKNVDKKYFKELLHKVPSIADEFEEALKPVIDRPFNEIDPVEISILGIAFYEMAKKLEVPYRVVINESIELAKVFGAEESYKFINGVVDKLSKTFRAIEVSAGKDRRRE